MGRRKVLTTVYLEPEQDELLKALSDRTGVPVAAYIRWGVDLVLREHGDALPGQLPLFEASPAAPRAPARAPARARVKRRRSTAS